MDTVRLFSTDLILGHWLVVAISLALKIQFNGIELRKKQTLINSILIMINSIQFRKCLDLVMKYGVVCCDVRNAMHACKQSHAHVHFFFSSSFSFSLFSHEMLHRKHIIFVYFQLLTMRESLCTLLTITATCFRTITKSFNNCQFQSIHFKW